jgi:antirestriction protein ArdC
LARWKQIIRRSRITFRCHRSKLSLRTCHNYSTLAHEHTHWTAKSERCDRQLGKRFGDNAYAAEELIAELGAAFVCAHLGFSTETREDHAQYINSWLKADKRAIFTAASKAQQAADYLIQRSERRAEVAA